MDESTIIDLIAEKLHCKNQKYGMGNFGDDAYLISPCTSSEVIVQSTDSFVEGTHFTKDMGYFSVGWKSLVSSISDVYAMGANPSFYSLNLIIPKEFKSTELDEFLEGLKQASDEYNVKLLGGDVTRGRAFCVIIQASGYQRRDFIKSNKGASRGDVLVTNADLGHALLGLEQFQKGVKDTGFVESFLYPKLNQELGQWLGGFNSVTSLTDISDGLHRELTNMCKLNDCSVMVESLPPLGADFLNSCSELGLNAEITALQGGEEYGLLWTVRPDFLQEFLTKYRIKFKTKPYLLGRIESNTAKKKISYENQDLIESIKPFEHFTS